MKTWRRRLAALLLIGCLLIQPAAALTDIAGHWSEPYVTRLVELGAVSGYEDGSFRPGEELRAGEFMKLLAEILALPVSGEGTVHWAQPWWYALSNEGLLNESRFPCTSEALSGSISRYEMAEMTYAVLRWWGWQDLAGADPGFADFAEIPAHYRTAVAQVCARGLLVGYEDGTFRGGNSLTRAEAATMLCRLLDLGPAADENFVPFAVRYQAMTESERREALFGDAEKTYFASAEEAAPYMVDITVPVWRLNEATGEKYAGTASLTVHVLVAEEVARIFQEIYNSPEQFPIKSVGCARFTDTMRHAWGCAIDINYNENAHGYYNDAGEFVCASGSGWWPGENPYSITATGSVVAAFARYGWGWGGQGYSSGYYDYMHFSILPSGG